MTRVFTGSPSIRSVSNTPTIITHPASQVVIANMDFTLNCEATGEGSITYQWKTRLPNGGQWFTIYNRYNSTLVSTVTKTRQYRCVVSNEAGSIASNVATITVLGK